MLGRPQKGFTLIEVLIVITIIGLLVSVVMVSLNATRAKGRDTQRATDLAGIINAVYQYAADNNNTLPTAITTSTTTICRTGAGSCTGLINLSVLTDSQKYMVSVPTDPLSTSTTQTGYTIVKNSFGRVTVSAPFAEAGTISVTR